MQRRHLKEIDVSPETDAGAEKIARYLNISSSGAAVWFLFYPRPHLAATLACLAGPALAIAVLAHSRGKLHLFKTSRKSSTPQVGIAFVASALVLALRSLFEYSLLDFAKGWLLLAGAAIVTGLVRRFAADIRANVWSIFPVFFFASVLAFGAVMQANNYFDTSEPEAYPAQVAGKTLQRTEGQRRKTAHYLKVTPSWGRNEDTVAVSPALFAKTKPGDRITIYVMRGALGISWYFVRTG